MEKLLFVLVVTMLTVSNVFAMEVSFEHPEYPAGTGEIKASITPGENEKVTGVSISPAEAGSVKRDGNNVTVTVKKGFTGTIVLTVKYAVFDKDGSEKEYDLIATAYTEIGGKCTYCHAWAEMTDKEPKIDTADKTDYYEINCQPTKDKTLDDVLGGDDLKEDLKKRLAEKEAELNKLIPEYNKLLEESNKLEAESEAKQKVFEDLNNQLTSLVEKFNALAEKFKDATKEEKKKMLPELKALKAQIDELNPKVKTASEEASAAYDAWAAAFEAFSKVENEVSSLDNQIASLKKSIADLEEKEKEEEKEDEENDENGESGKPNGWHVGSRADFYFFNESKGEYNLKCTACGEEKVMYRHVETFKDIDVKPLLSLIVLPKWNQVNKAGRKTKKAWKKFVDALEVHENGHRGIYDTTYRQPAVALLKHFYSQRFIGEVHIPDGGSKEDIEDKVKDVIDKSTERLKKALAKLDTAEKKAQDSYEEITDHGRTQNSHDDFKDADNTEYPDIPLTK